MEPARTNAFGTIHYLCIFGVIVFFSLHFCFHGFEPMSIANVDETAWIYGSYYYHLAFDEKDLFSREWRVRDAIDHPPVGKYFVGAALAAGGYFVPTVQLKHQWYERTDVNEQQILVEEAKRLPPAVLPLGRFMSTLTFAASSLLLAWITYQVVGPGWSAVGAAAALFASPMIRSLAVNVMPEGPFVFLIVLSAALHIRIAHLWLRGKPAYVTVLIAGIVAGLLTDTKINGFASVPLGMVSLFGTAILTRPQAGKQWPYNAFTPLLFGFVALVSIILANPSLWIDPVRMIEAMIRYRVLNLEGQLAFVYPLAMPTLAIKVSSVLDTVFCRNDPFSPVCLLLPLAFLGVIRASKEMPSKPAQWWILAVHGIGWFACNWLTYQISGPRYFIATMPFVFLLAGVGLDEVAAGLRRIASTPARRVSWAVAALLLMVSLPFITSRITTAQYMETHPEWVAQCQKNIEEIIRSSEESAPVDEQDVLQMLAPR